MDLSLLSGNCKLEFPENFIKTAYRFTNFELMLSQFEINLHYEFQVCLVPTPLAFWS